MPLLDRFRITIPMKIALLVLTTVLVSVVVFASYIFSKVKRDQEKSFANTVSNFGMMMGEHLWRIQEDTKKDMTNILALTNPSAPVKSLDSIRVILQKNAHLVYFELVQIDKSRAGHKELVQLFNENVFVSEPSRREELALQIEKDINSFAERNENELNYHFRSLPNQFPVYIFELDKKKGIFAAFALAKNVFSQIYNPVLSPVSSIEITLLNDNREILFTSDKAGAFPIHTFANSIESRSTNQGLVERFRGGLNASEFAAHYYRVADGVTLLTYKDLSSAGLDKRNFVRDVLFFCGSLSFVMLIISLGFSTGLSSRIRKLMGLTENIAAGNYKISNDLRARDEVGELADHFRILGERLGEKDLHFEKVTEMANRDGLTGVYNRRYFRERYEELFLSSRESNKPLSLILLDIDHYKRFNDEYGHQQGDIVLQQLAHLLLTLTRKNDLVARFGGDEFAVLLVNTDLHVASHIAERIREAFQHKRISRLGQEGSLSGTCSVGVACVENMNYPNADALVAAADDHLYKAKKNGRNQVYSGLES